MFSSKEKAAQRGWNIPVFLSNIGSLRSKTSESDCLHLPSLLQTFASAIFHREQSLLPALLSTALTSWTQL